MPALPTIRRHLSQDSCRIGVHAPKFLRLCRELDASMQVIPLQIRKFRQHVIKRNADRKVTYGTSIT